MEILYHLPYYKADMASIIIGSTVFFILIEILLIVVNHISSIKDITLSEIIVNLCIIICIFLAGIFIGNHNLSTAENLFTVKSPKDAIVARLTDASYTDIIQRYEVIHIYDDVYELIEKEK